MYGNGFFIRHWAGARGRHAIGLAFAPRKKNRGASGKFIKAVGDMWITSAKFMAR
jgi:hypothetical protein